MNDTISLKEVLDEMDQCRYLKTTKSFSLRYLTCSRTRKTGGKWVYVKETQIGGLPYSVRENEMRGLVDLASGIKTGIHYHLIFEFNERRVFK